MTCLDTITEMGSRVLAAELAENTGSETHRVKVIRDRVNHAERRAAKEAA